jgi:hypothetical protein
LQRAVSRAIAEDHGALGVARTNLFGFRSRPDPPLPKRYGGAGRNVTYDAFSHARTRVSGFGSRIDHFASIAEQDGRRRGWREGSAQRGLRIEDRG